MTLSKIIRKITKEYDVQNFSLHLLRDGPDNIVYTIKSDHLGENLILRISKRNLGNDVLFELTWIDELGKKGIPVAPIVQTKKGKSFFFVDEKSVGVVFKFIPGSHLVFGPNDKPDLELVKKAAQTLALLHIKSKEINISLPRKRTVFIELERALEKKEIFKSLIKGGEKFIEEAEKYLKWGLEQKYEPVFIHNDFRVKNILFKGSNLAAVIDFDWSCMGPAIKDLAHSLVEWSYLDKAQKPWQDVFNVFLDAYNQVSSKKYKKSTRLYQWINLSCLSDTATWLIDFIEQGVSKRVSSSYMYQKFLYYTRIF